MKFRTTQTRQTSLSLRVIREGVVVVQASNDTVRDSYGTIITVEGLHNWAEGFLEHRTISQQHNMDMRGVKGKPQVGMAVGVDFTPQLEVEVRVDDPDTWRLIEQGKITGASLEFVPLPDGIETRTDGDTTTEIYHQLSSAPEACSLTLCDIPAVPGAELLEFRGMPANWQFAVVDPGVLNLRVTDPAEIAALRWFDHHDPKTHLVDTAKLRACMEQLESNSFTVPAGSSLSREQIIHRASQHLQRHTNGLGVRMKGEQEMNTWIKLRMQQLMAEGLSEAEATTKAQEAFNALSPEVRSKIEGADAPKEAAPVTQRYDRDSGTVVVNVVGREQEQPQERTAQPAQAPAAPATPATPEITPEMLSAALESHPQFRAMMNQPESSSAALAGWARPKEKLEGDKLLAEVFARSVVPQLAQQQVTPEMRSELDNVLASAGISNRAITLEANGTVIYEELARQFAVKPEANTIFRNHMQSVAMGGTATRTFPRFDGGGITHVWGRTSTTAITASDPTLDTFTITPDELNSKVVVPDSFSLFNAQGTSFISQTLIPSMRAQAQLEEDRAFFMSTGTSTDPDFKGLKSAASVTAVTPSTNGDAFTEEILGSLLRAMPVAYRGNPNKLAFYVPVPIGDDLQQIRSARATTLGDAALANQPIVPGPAPIARHRGINVYSVPALPTDETQGSSDVAGTIFLVHRDIPVIGDAYMIRIEPYRKEDFITSLQLQAFVGLGYQWPAAIVRRAGVLAATFS